MKLVGGDEMKLPMVLKFCEAEVLTTNTPLALRQFASGHHQRRQQSTSASVSDFFRIVVQDTAAIIAKTGYAVVSDEDMFKMVERSGLELQTKDPRGNVHGEVNLQVASQQRANLV